MSTSRKPSAAVKKTAATRPASKTKATPAASKSAAPAAKAPAKASVQTIGLEEIKSLIALVGREPFQEFEFEAGDMRFRIRKDGPAPVIQAPLAAPIVMAAPAPQVHHIPSAPVAPQAAAVPVDEPGIHYVTSPIVGTFYRASNPTATPFASPGDFVKPGQTLCIIEAMKLMNEIESDVAGEVVKVLVENGTPVEYGERLFAVRIG
ncbi:MAG: acetyl-CoA carboxylase biotin carboxyl carrier protein [Geothrix sp.]|uniref:acetyl-CoA carboxylase biotin carboxyl carrier protein n=1 Tax=Geothrix sp. TaxID=1962974 RepID=UPI00183DCFF5|nr:acetyl-CoA carboxylase biotin carboxyl carrier protein [Geothrix sp.]NWJ40389.1 acetyl-CoA carboxylase biotin carboxyl carrier protein [Geothrix sp.]WIL21606.1 MAG: acetyl-CoA carboxylase biotin carboxyl carrier protein [Geothrix sp.]